MLLAAVLPDLGHDFLFVPAMYFPRAALDHIFALETDFTFIKSMISSKRKGRLSPDLCSLLLINILRRASLVSSADCRMHPEVLYDERRSFQKH